MSEQDGNCPNCVRLREALEQTHASLMEFSEYGDYEETNLFDVVTAALAPAPAAASERRAAGVRDE